MTDLGSRRCPADAEAVSCGFRPVLDCLPQPVVPGRQSKCTDTPGPQHRYEAGCRLPVALFPVLGRDGLLAADKLRTRAFCPYGVLSRGGRPCALQFPFVSLRMPQLRARAARGRFRMALLLAVAWLSPAECRLTLCIFCCLRIASFGPMAGMAGTDKTKVTHLSVL